MTRIRALGITTALFAGTFSCSGPAPDSPPPASDIQTTEHAATVPTGFVETVVASNLTSPTAIAALPDGRVFAAQQDGKLRIIKNDALLATPFIDLTSETDSTYERGLLGVATDPNFATNNYVYIYFTTKPPAASSVHNRLIRVTANGDVANTSTRVTLLDFPDLPTAWTTRWHMGGAIHFGPDGKMYVAVGDHQSGMNDTGKTPANRPPQVLTSVFGKILRFNADGTIPTDNPFYGSTTGLNRSIWARGLRNPFTFNIKSDGKVFISDVGESTWEEIDVAATGGKNFGWPLVEGNNNYGTSTPNTDPNFTPPSHAYGHNSTRCSVVGAAFYEPTTAVFPSSYVGKFFFADFCSTKIFQMDPTTYAVSDFASGISYPTDLTVASNGAMYYLARGQKTGTPTSGLGKVYKISYTGTTAPQISQQPESITVTTGSAAAFSVVANNATSYQWQRFNTSWANISGATSASYTISATVIGDNGAKFRCNVTNANGTTTSSEATLTVTGNQLPVASILEPSLTTTYEGGQVIGFVGSATDAEDGTMPASAFTWQVDFQHDTHSHPFIPPTSGIKSGTFTIPSADQHPGPLTWYRVYMLVTDSGGRQVQIIRDIRPATHLSDMTETSSTNGYGPMEKDKSNGEAAAGDGNTITIDGFQYPKGLGVHAPSDVRYNLNGACSGDFIADVGVDDEKTAGSVIFQVWMDGVKTYDSGVVTAATPRQGVFLSVAGVNELKLIVDINGSTNSDHADWAGARVTGCSSSAGGPRKRIGYYPIWDNAGDDLTVTYPQAPASVPWSQITHLNLAFIGINPSFNCAFIDPTDAAMTSWQTNAQALISYRNAHAPGVKILMTIGGWTMSHRFSEAMSSANRTTFVNSCVSLMNTIGADGIDIDWEFPTNLGAENCPSGHTCELSSDPANLTATLTAFRANTSFAGKLLTAALSPNRAGASGNIPYEYQNFFTGTPRRLDWVSVITYDYHGPWETAVNFTSPYDKCLSSMDYIVKGANGVDDTTDGVGSANKGRVLLGVPYFGPAWYNVATPGTSGVGGSGTPIVAPPLEAKASFGKAKANFVNRYPGQCTVTNPTTGNVQNRYAYCTGTVGFCVGAIGNGSSSTCATNGGTWTTRDNVWMSYEDATVVGTKADWVGINNWGGMMWWTQGEDTDSDELTAMIASKLSLPMQNPVIQSAYPAGTPWSIAGTIEAEDFDMVPEGNSGEGEAYHDSTAGNNGTDPDYRADDVDTAPTADTAGGGQDVTSTTAGEWLEYTVNVGAAGSFDMDLRVASSTNTRTMHAELDGQTLGATLAIPDTTGDPTGYMTVTQTVTLTAGQHVLKIVFDTGAVSLNWIRFTASAPPPAPSAPTGLVATAGDAKVDLAWNASSGATNYTVKRSTTSGSGYADVQTVTGTTFSNTGLTNGTTYYFVVVASNSGGTSDPSNEDDATPQGPPPPVWTTGDVGSVTPAGTYSESGGTITMEGAGADIWGTADGFRFAYQQITGDATIIARVVSVENTAQYAKAGLMMRKDLTAGSINTFVENSPGTVTVMKMQKRPTAGAVSTSTNDAASGPNRWLKLVRSGTNFTASWSTNGTTWTTPTGWNNQAITGLSGTIYVGLAVTSHANGTLCTAVFDNVSLTTPAPPSPPAAPSNLAATGGAGQAVLTWTDNSDNETTFKIERKVSTDPDTSYAQIATAGSNATGYTNTGVAAGTYSYRVRASNSAGDSAYTSSANATVTTASAIASLTVNDTTTGSDGIVNSTQWSVQSNFTTGLVSFGDRTYTVDSIGNSVLTGKPWIRTAADSKASTANPLASFVLTGSYVYLLIDDRHNTAGRPAWLTDMAYVDQGYNVVIRQSATATYPYSVWRKPITSGSTVNLPTINSSAAPAYIVVVQ